MAKHGKDKKARDHDGDPVRSGGHRAATAHGQATKVDDSLPATRAELLAEHSAARLRRAQAPLGGEAYRAAVDDLARIEIRIAAIERDQAPSKG